MNLSFLKPPIGGIIGLEMITFVEPLGLECVAGGLEEHGHTCQIIDLRIDGFVRGFEKLRAFGPEVVGLQCNFTTERFRALRLARRVKEEFPGALLVIGGHDASRAPEWFARAPFDVVVVGDGEEVMPGLVDAWAAKRDLRGVAGLVIVGPHGTNATGPAPARRNRRAAVPGAPSDPRVRERVLHQLPPPAGIAGDGARLSVQMQFLFGLEIPRKHLPREIAGARGPGAAPDRRAQCVHYGRYFLDEREARARARRGIEGVGNPQALHAADAQRHHLQVSGRRGDVEGLRPHDGVRAIRILQELGVGYTPNFIVDPSWDYEDFEKLRRWVDETGAYNSGFSVLTPLPGTDLWDEAEESIVTNDWELFDIAHTVLPTKLPRDEFYRQYAGLWKHALDVRYQVEGRMRTHLGLIAALATRRVTVTALRKGMRMGSRLANPESFLRAHRESEARLAAES